MHSVTVCIASLGRTSLLATLKSIQKTVRQDIKLDIIIADDSGNNAVTGLIGNEEWQIPINVVAAGGRNVAIARNVCLAHAGGDYLAFVDDDEIAKPDWLEKLLATALEFRADAVFGPVDAVFPDDTPDWMRKAGPFIKRPGARGQPVQTGATCNALVRRAFVRQHALTFREEFGRTGGEDTDFFARMCAAGGRLVATDDAFLWESVPAERLRLSDLRRRYTRGGQTYARISLERATTARRGAFYASAAIRLIVSAAVVLVTVAVKKDTAMRYALRVWLNIGKLRHMLKLPLFEIY